MLHALGKGAGFVATQHSSKTCKLIFAGLFAGVNKSLTGRTALVSVHHNLSSDASVSRAFSTASYVPDVDEDIVVVDGDIESTALLYYYKKWDHARTLRPLFLQREDKERNGCNNRQLKAARKICANLGLPAPSMMEAPSAFPGLGWGTHACDGLKVLESLQQRPRAVIFPIARDSNNIRTHPLAFGAPTAQETPSKPSVDDETGMRQLHVVLRRVGSIPLVWPWSQKTRAEVIALGQECGVPWEDTWSCWNGPADGDLHCGCCLACSLRHKAFAAAGVAEDPRRYKVFPPDSSLG